MFKTVLFVILGLLAACGGRYEEEIPLALKTIDIPLTKGIDESADPSAVKFAFTSIANLHYNRAGELVPRDPMKQESSIAYRSRRLLTAPGGPVVLAENANTDNADLVLYRRDATAKSWSSDIGIAGSRGDISSAPTTQFAPLLSDVQRQVINSSAGVHDSTAAILTHGIAVYGNYRMHVTCDSYDTTIRFYENDQLIGQHTYTDVIFPKVFSTLYDGVHQGWIVFVVDTSGNIKAYKWAETKISSWPAATTITLGATTTISTSYPTWDVYVGSGGGYSTIFQNTAGNFVWISGTWAAGLAIGDLTVLKSSPVLASHCALYDNFAVWVNGSANITEAAVIDLSAGTATGTLWATPMEFVAVGYWDSLKAIALGSRNTSIGTPSITTGEMRAAIITSDGEGAWTSAVLNNGVGGVGTQFGYQFVGQPVRTISRSLVMTVTEGVAGPTGAGMKRLIAQQWEADTAYPFPVLVGDAFVGARMTYGTVRASLPRAIYTGGRVYFPALEYSADLTETKAVLYSAEVNGIHVGSNAYDGKGVELGGGLPVALDSAGSPENVPIVYPQVAAQAGASTGITGTVSYIGVFEVSDSEGRLGWSAPSVATSPLTLTNQDATITVPQLFVTRIPTTSTAKCKLYRSTNSGPYHLVTTISLGRTTTGYENYTDASADVTANSLLYSDGSDGSEVERFCPPYTTTVAYARGRMWAASGNRAYFSQPIDSQFMPQWSDVFYVELPARITAMRPVRDILLFFTDSALYYLAGDGPDRAAAGNAFGLPSVVTLESGAAYDLGGDHTLSVGAKVYFRSRRGIEEIDLGTAVGGGEPKIISVPIQKTLDSYPVVLDAAYWPERDESVWLLSDSSTGRATMVYHHGLQAWTRYTNADGFTDAETVLVYDDKLFTGTADNGVWVSDSTLLTTAVSAANIEFTGRPFGNNGFGELQRVVFEGTSNGNFAANLTFTADGTAYSVGSTSYSEATWPSAAALTLDHKVRTPRLTEFKALLSTGGAKDTGSETNYDRPPKWHSIRLELRQLPGGRRVGSGAYL